MSERSRKNEWVPWYRAKDYKGTLTEAQKRQLDAFRSLPKHPATMADDLPDDVRAYVSGLEFQVYDLKQDAAAEKALFFSFVGAALLFLHYNGRIEATVWAYGFDALLIVVPWVVYNREWKKNAAAFRPRDPSVPNPTDEGIRQEWELEYLSRAEHNRRAEHEYE